MHNYRHMRIDACWFGGPERNHVDGSEHKWESIVYTAHLIVGTGVQSTIETNFLDRIQLRFVSNAERVLSKESSAHWSDNSQSSRQRNTTNRDSQQNEIEAGRVRWTHLETLRTVDTRLDWTPPEVIAGCNRAHEHVKATSATSVLAPDYAVRQTDSERRLIWEVQCFGWKSYFGIESNTVCFVFVMLVWWEIRRALYAMLSHFRTIWK